MSQSPGYKYNKTLRPKVVASTWTLCEYTDPKRRWCLLQNQSDEAMTIGFGSDTEQPSHGIILGEPSAADVYLAGGRYEMSLALGNLTAQAIWAKCASGTKTLMCAMASDDLPAEPAVGLSSSSSSDSSASSASASSRSASSASSASSDNSSESNSSRSASSLSSVSGSSLSASSASASSASSVSASSVSTSSYSSVSESSSSSTGP